MAARYSLPLCIDFLPLRGPPRPHTRAGSKGRGDQRPGGDIGQGKPSVQTPTPKAQGWRGPRGARTAAAFRHSDRNCSSGSQSRLKHLWRLETEFENPPISGGRRGAPGQSRGGTARAHRPLESWRSWPRVSPAVAQLLPPGSPSPFRVPGNLGPASQFLLKTRAGRPREAKVGGGRGGGRRKRALLLCIKDPLKSPGLAARGDRGHSQGWGKQMEFGKTIYTPWMLLPPPPAPQQPAQKPSCPGLLGQTS